MNKKEAGLQLVSSTEWVRAVAIFLIVAGHFEMLHYGGGASYTMLVLAGVTYAKYILPKLSVDAASARRLHVLLMLKIGLPTLAYTVLVQTLFAGGLDWRSLLLITNFYEPTYFAYWFIEVYVQINLILWLMSVPTWGRRILLSWRQPAWACLGLIAAAALAWLSQLAWDTSGLYDRVPNQMLWFFAAGILYGAVDGAKYQRWACGALVLAVSFMLGKPSWLLGVAVLVLVLLPQVPAPRWLSWAVESVAGASLMIYLTHFQWASLWHKLVPQGNGWGGVVFALLGGVVLYQLYGRVWGMVRPVLDSLLSRWSIFSATPKP
jgi:hypothetical protein